MSDGSLGLIRFLSWLRWLAVGGQAIAVFLVVHVWQVPLEKIPLWGGILALAAFNLWAGDRPGRPGGESEIEVLLHIAFDVAVLAWLIAWSGGSMNPFVSFFLLPIALVTVALRRWAVLVVCALCTLGYAAAVAGGRPLPHAHALMDDSLDLHLWGMAATFAISAALLIFFLSQLARALQARERELARMQEKFTRNEGIVALATHAASVAHALNTPLGSLTLMIEDQLAETKPGTPQRADTELMASLVNACRDRVRELAAPANGPDADERSLPEQIDATVLSWQLLRPAVALQRSVHVSARADFTLDPGIGHLLQVLLNNAADASAQSHSSRVDLDIAADDEDLRGAVRDYGPGIDAADPPLPARLFRTNKPHGWGMGLALSHAAVERLGGELAMEDASGGGTVVRFRVPLHKLGRYT